MAQTSNEVYLLFNSLVSRVARGSGHIIYEPISLWVLSCGALFNLSLDGGHRVFPELLGKIAKGV